jgi:hypothetical protein
MSTAVDAPVSVGAAVRPRRAPPAEKPAKGGPARKDKLSKEIQDIMVKDAAKMAARKQKEAEAKKSAGTEVKKRKKNRRNKDSDVEDAKPADADNKKEKNSAAPKKGYKA